MKQMVRSVRLNMMMLLGKRRWVVPAVLAVPIAVTVVLGVVAKAWPGAQGYIDLDSVTSFMCAIVTVVATMMPFIIASIEGNGSVGRLSGVVPMTRRQQVEGRYAFVIAFAVLVFVQTLVVRLLYLAFSPPHVPAAMVRAEIMGDISTLGTILLLCLILFPVCYRFPGSPALTIAFCATLVAVIALAIVASSVPAFVAVAGWVAEHILVNALASVLFETGVVLVVGIISLCLSLRFFTRREF